MSSSRKNTFRANLFSPHNITSLEDVESALSELQSVFTEHNYEHVLGELLETPHLAELVLSDLSAVPLKSWLLEHFPTTPTTFISSFTCKLLSKLAMFFLFPPISFPEEVLDLMGQFHMTVKHGPSVLQDLFAMTFADEGQHETEVPKSTKGRSKSQWKDKQPRKAGIRQIVFDPKLMAALELTIPSTFRDRDNVIADLLNRLKDILEYYLAGISLPGITQTLKKAFALRERPQRLTVVTNLAASPEGSSSAATESAIANSAYPKPLKSALYFDSAEGFGEWLILISSTADSDLRQARRKDKKVFQIIVKKIRELSNGHFSDDNQKRLSGPTTEVPIFEAKMVRDLRLVYQVDCVARGNETEQQVLKIWGVYTHAQLDNRLWASLSHQLDKKGKIYQSRCNFRRRPHNAGDNVFLPASWPMLDDAETTPTINVPDLPPDELSQLHSILVLEKFVTFSKELLFSMLADLDVAFPFEVSPRERAVIEYPYSCYVLGRSGTGKTTTMLYKMLWVERLYQLCAEDATKPRQVFVTKSRLLAGKVEEYFEKLLNSLATMSCSPEELKNLAKSKQVKVDRDLVALNDIPDWRSDLPSKYGDLEDRHFPLFITFDQLSSMLEASLAELDNDDECLWDGSYSARAGFQTPNRRSSKALLCLGERITYKRFESEYWSHFPELLKKGLDSVLVFNEIMGVICGSEESISTSHGFMDRASYENLSCRTHPTFAQARTTIYNIFLHYHQKKLELGDYDAAERTHTIIANFNQSGIPGQKFDHLYVDEAQDNLLVDALLLRSLCHNPDGLFWAGDTAQTISVGSSFRFDDLKAFLFRVEKQREHKLFSLDSRYLIQEPPKTFHLSVNYRSHGGIVNCAHSLIDLISKFWPYSIDILSPERGIVDGAKPTFFTGGTAGTPADQQIRFRKTNENVIELGAHQCILVRNEAARERLHSLVGPIGIILTLYESKGLEFNDVLLYDFFHDSTLDVSQWRVVLNAVDDNVAAPTFDEMRHAAICSELKFLYVAITRARNNLWIADSSLKADPMKAFWMCRNLIINLASKFHFTELAVESSPEEWGIRAKDFFDREQFAQARRAYEKASLPSSAAVANAYDLREIARNCSFGSTRALLEPRMKAFAIAAEAFLSCAGEAIQTPEDYYRAAAGCFEKAGDSPQGAPIYLPKAARTYLLAKSFTNAAQQFRKAAMFDEAIEVINKYTEQVEEKVAAQIKDVVRLRYFTQKEFEKAHTLFDSIEEELEYLDDRNLDTIQVELLIYLGRVADAAELHLSKGRAIEALELFHKDEGDPNKSMRRAIHCISEGLWREFSLGIRKSSTNLGVKFLHYADLIDQSLLSQNDRDEMELFRMISSGTFKNLVSIADTFFERQNLAAVLLSLDYHFSAPHALQNMDLVSLVATLQTFSFYARQLHDATFHVNPRTTDYVWKVLGLRPHGQTAFVVPDRTFLHKMAFTRGSTVEGSRDLIISVESLPLMVRSALSQRLLDRVIRQNDMCRRARALFPCPRHVILGGCLKTDCTEDHIEPGPVWYNTWIQVHLYQILIYQTINRDDLKYSSDSRKSQRTFWIGKPYDALNPQAHKIERTSGLKQESSDDFRAGFQVIVDWIRDLTYNLDFSSSVETQFLTQVMQAADLSFTFNRNEAHLHLYHSRFTTTATPLQYLRKLDHQNSLSDVLFSYQNSKSWSVLVGTLFVQQIIRNRLPVEIDELCTYIEHLCAATVVFNCAQRTGGLHNVTLPRNWLSKVLTHFSLDEATDKIINFWRFPLILGDLIKEIYTGIGAEYLLFGPELRQLKEEIYPIRNTFIARLYRVLGLLGYNIPDPQFKDQILKISNAMQRFGHPPYSSLYRRYVNAWTWGGISHATRESMQGSTLDEMVHLQHAAQIVLPIQEVEGLRRIVYSVTEDIPGLLQSGFEVPSTSISDGPEGSLGVGAEPLNLGNEDHIADNLNDDVDDEDPPEYDANPPVIVIEDISQEVASTPSAEQLHATSVLQRAFRRYLTRQNEKKQHTLSDNCLQSIFALCLQLVKKNKWERSPYKFYFLGPLPHILACLHAAQATVLAKKDETKKLFRRGDIKNEALNDISSQLTLTVNAHKELKRMLKALEPTAEVHRRRNLVGLKALIKEAVNLLWRLALKGTEDTQLYLDITYNSVREPKKRAQKGKNPS